MTKDEMLAEAERLTKLQAHERGTEDVKDGEGRRQKVNGPYVATPEREARAAQIIRLRQAAARL